jgi:hypothetical protein
MRLLIAAASTLCAIAPSLWAAATVSWPAGAPGGVALALHAMVTAEPSGQPWAASADQLRPVHDLLGFQPGQALTAEALESNAGVRATLEPLLLAMQEKDPKLAGPFTPEAIAAALPRARQRVRNTAAGLLDALDLFDASSQENAEAIRSNHELARRLYLYNGAYLDGEGDEAALRSLFARWTRKDEQARQAAQRRGGAAAERQIRAAEQNWDKRSDEDGQGGVAELPEPGARRAADSLLSSDAVSSTGEAERRRRLILERQQEAEFQRQEYFKLDTYSGLISQYPLAATRERYAVPLEQAAEAGDVMAFWSNVSGAFADLDTRVDELLALMAAGTMDPQMRVNHLHKLAMQIDELHDDVSALYAAKKPGSKDFKLNRRGDGKRPHDELHAELLAKVQGSNPEHLSEELDERRRANDPRALASFSSLARTWKLWLRQAPEEVRGELEDLMRRGYDGRDRRVMGIQELGWNARKLSAAGGPVTRLRNRLLLLLAGMPAGAYAAIWAIGQLGRTGLVLGSAVLVLSLFTALAYFFMTLGPLLSFWRARRWVAREARRR